MSHKLISLSLVAMLISCGDNKSSSGKNPNTVDPTAPNTQTTPAANPNLKESFTMVQAQFKGSYIGVQDGQIYNFDSEQKPLDPLQFKFADSKDATNTILSTLERRPQRIDVVNQDFVLLQRPHYQSYSAANSTNLEQDCFLINIKTGAIWKFDEFFPEVNTLQVVEKGASRKILFIGRKKDNGNTGWMSLDLKNDYNYNTTGENGYSRSLPSTSPRVIVSIDFSDSQQVTLRPLSSGIDQIDKFLADSQGNVLAQTTVTSNSQSRTLAILQNEQSPIEVTMTNANITSYGSSWDSRVLLDSQRNFWRFTREYLNTSPNYQVKAERLILARDLNDRPALIPIATMTQTMSSASFRLDGGVWSSTYKDSELFGFTGLLALVDTTASKLSLLNDSNFATGSATLNTAAVDSRNGKVLAYHGTYGNGTPSITVYDIADAAAYKATTVNPESLFIYGALRSLNAAVTGGFDVETMDGPNINVYHFDGVNKATLIKSTRIETDNRVRVLVPVTSIP